MSRLRYQDVQQKKRAAENARICAETKPDGKTYLNATQAAWCLNIGVGDIVAAWRRGELASANRGLGSKVVIAMSELERWQSVYRSRV